MPLGEFTRNMHRWSAHAMVLVVILHMARVFYTGAYKPPREFNWVVGVILLLLTLGASFTGYLLPWDQLSFWAITIGTNIAGYAPVLGPSIRQIMLGGTDVGQNALIRFYALHVVVLPLLAVLLISLHLWRVRKDGGLAANDVTDSTVHCGTRETIMSDQPPVSDEIFPKNTNKTYSLVEVVRGDGPLVGKGPDDTVFAFPIVLLLEIILLLGVTLLIFLFSLIKHAPLETIANPLVTTDPAKAPWYFMGLQELLEHMHPFVAGVLLPTHSGAVPDRRALHRSFARARRRLVFDCARQTDRPLDGALRGDCHARLHPAGQRFQRARTAARQRCPLDRAGAGARADHRR